MNFQILKLVLKKAEEPEIKLLKSTASLKEQESLRKNIYFCFIDSAKFLTVQIKTNCGKFLEMGIPDHLICLLRNLYAGQEATLRTVHRTTVQFSSVQSLNLV